MKSPELILYLAFVRAKLEEEGNIKESEAVTIAIKLLCDSNILNDKEKDYKI